ncbi:hypothetical protein [Hyphococcus luteus]|uniref:hypothetical protein n=1 Tax=Hyphococcus luteus TaxID=2058213 RepID=UPI001057410E|nr:hypothetical protein [Marinicaulis flavus]
MSYIIAGIIGVGWAIILQRPIKKLTAANHPSDLRNQLFGTLAVTLALLPFLFWKALPVELPLQPLAWGALEKEIAMSWLLAGPASLRVLFHVLFVKRASK